MAYLVAYDISEDRRRSQVVKVLLDYGLRVQDSVFWADVDEEISGRMLRRLEAIVDAKEDVLWVVPVCGRCGEGMRCLGPQKAPERPKYWVL